MSIKSINPFSLEVLKTFDEMTNEQIDHALEKAHSTFLKWKTTSYDERATILNKVGAILRAKKTELSKSLSIDLMI